jgi:hypothetical protein
MTIENIAKKFQTMFLAHHSTPLFKVLRSLSSKTTGLRH